MKLAGFVVRSRRLLLGGLLGGCLQLLAVVAPPPAGASLYGTGRGYCAQAEAGGYALGPSVPTSAGDVYACGPVPLNGNGDTGPAIPKFWPITDLGGFQCTELAIRYLYLATGGRVLVDMRSEGYWSGAGKDFAASVGGHFGFGGQGQHIDGVPSGSLPKVGDLLSELVSPHETHADAGEAARAYGDVGVVRSVSAGRIVLMVENNNGSGLNTIEVHNAAHWGINSPGNGYYYTTFQWFSPTSAVPAAPSVTMPPSPYRYSVYGTRSLSEGASPSVTSSVEHTLADGDTVYLTCQAAGPNVHGSSLWDKLTNGGWVPDYFVDTPNVGTFSYPVPPCVSPGYWDYPLRGTAPVSELPGPAALDKALKTVPAGSTAQVVCFTSGATVEGTSTWDYLLDRTYVPNAYVAAPADVGVPQCPHVNPSGQRQNRGGAPTTTTPSPVQKVAGAAPGQGSPAAVVAAFYTELLVDESVTGACNYLLPSEQAACQAGAAMAGPVTSTGHILITATVTDGDRALVATTGSLCQTGSPCLSNHDARLGLPTDTAGFDAAYNTALNNDGSHWGAVPCRLLGDKWYLDANI